jgi:hypothetical protein
VVMVLTYVLEDQPMPLALLAKIYTVDPDCTPPEDPHATDWRAAFSALFESIASVEVRGVPQLTMKSSLDAAEATLAGVSADHGVPLRIRERRSVRDREQFIVTAMGSPTAFEAHATEVDAWFATVAFVPLADQPP